MTKEEIKNLIDAKLTGQGNQIDISGALPTILKEIVDMAGGSEGEVVLASLNGEELFFENDRVQLTPNQINIVWRSIFGHDFVEDTNTLIRDKAILRNKIVKLVDYYIDEDDLRDGYILSFQYYEANDSASIFFTNHLSTITILER